MTIYENSTVRDYVTKFEEILDPSDNIYKGESEGEDLSSLSEETIWKKLKDRIYDSSVTVVFISPEMKESWKAEKDQWIPWEISYSLKEVSRKNKNGDAVTSRSNAMVAVVLPDIYMVLILIIWKVRIVVKVGAQRIILISYFQLLEKINLI